MAFGPGVLLRRIITYCRRYSHLAYYHQKLVVAFTVYVSHVLDRNINLRASDGLSDVLIFLYKVNIVEIWHFKGK